MFVHWKVGGGEREERGEKVEGEGLTHSLTHSHAIMKSRTQFVYSEHRQNGGKRGGREGGEVMCIYVSVLECSCHFSHLLLIVQKECLALFT